ncbi:MAG: hypothetical protein FJZ00_03935 [Candidatus Sericytochromatia bacterium]|uniref:Uncharacterized protein n=1 Tax=Candidatus Tanganyikabacteria bacterium TaxID=2961651 RepID=A0A938BIE5_9BACT|nr:hypothetical protein [Candidatus Tanganyikabacteria bacterium]
MEVVRLNGRPLPAVVVAVNPAIDRDASHSYLSYRKDGLDTIGVEAAGRHLVLSGKGFPERLKTSDRLEISGQAAKVYYQENEVNTFSEGFFETVQSDRGAGYLIGGLIGGAGIAYGAILLGLMTFPVALAMLGVGIVGALASVTGVGIFGGLKARNRATDFKIIERLSDPNTKLPGVGQQAKDVQNRQLEDVVAGIKAGLAA